MRTSYFLVPKKYVNTDEFLVRSWGRPRKKAPGGAVEVLYGREKLPFSLLKKKERKTETMRFIVVELPDSGNNNRQTTSDRQVKKNLLNLKPWNYFKASSDPKFELRSRAVLQHVKPSLHAVNTLLGNSRRELLQGSKPYGVSCLYRSLKILRDRDKWSLYDHLLYRYVRWAIVQYKSVKRTLEILGLTSQELANPLLKGKLHFSLGILGSMSHLPSADCISLVSSLTSPQCELPALTPIP